MSLMFTKQARRSISGCVFGLRASQKTIRSTGKADPLAIWVVICFTQNRRLPDLASMWETRKRQSQ
jgi:hypothetical protein